MLCKQVYTYDSGREKSGEKDKRCHKCDRACDIESHFNKNKFGWAEKTSAIEWAKRKENTTNSVAREGDDVRRVILITLKNAVGNRGMERWRRHEGRVQHQQSRVEHQNGREDHIIEGKSNQPRLGQS